ncbi:hypothetical protein Q3G72_026666 [Acer saccharum]|nr:hypothetical protein Q3G72_026666 [Acer saccharum]
MEQLVCGFNSLNNDLLLDIMGRLDGLAMASAGCTCSTILPVTCYQNLWQQLCHSTWPSTALQEAQHLLSSSSTGGFHRFYADSYPLILCNKPANENYPKTPKCPKPETHICLPDFVSLLDIYYKNECVLSKVFDGVPEVVNFYQDNNMGCNCGGESNPSYHQYDEDNCHCDIDDDQSLGLPTTLLDYGKFQDNYYEELAKHLRLSWVLLDKKKGKAVNLSSWKPLSVKRNWLNNGNYEIHFGCIILVDESVLPHKLAKCIISATCKIIQNAGHLRWKEISIHIEDITGAHIGAQQSLLVVNQALYSLRSKNHLEVEKGYRLYDEKKRELMKKKAFQDKLADWLCMSIQITVFVICLYPFVLPS